jgi:hypothetical protein
VAENDVLTDSLTDLDTYVELLEALADKSGDVVFAGFHLSPGKLPLSSHFGWL